MLLDLLEEHEEPQLVLFHWTLIIPELLERPEDQMEALLANLLAKVLKVALQVMVLEAMLQVVVLGAVLLVMVLGVKLLVMVLEAVLQVRLFDFIVEQAEN